MNGFQLVRSGIVACDQMVLVGYISYDILYLFYPSNTPAGTSIPKFDLAKLRIEASSSSSKL